MTDSERYAIAVRKVIIDGQELWRATVRELPDLAEFADTREEALDLALDSIESLKASAIEEGRAFPDPIEDEEEFSGRVTLRMSKSMHRTAAMQALNEDVSLNAYIVECIALRSAVRAAYSAEAASVAAPWHGFGQMLGASVVCGAGYVAFTEATAATSHAFSVQQQKKNTQFAMTRAAPQLLWGIGRKPSDERIERKLRQ